MKALISAVLAAAVLGSLGPARPALSAPAHSHGDARLEVTVDADKLTVRFESPLDNLLGYERAPKTAAERQAAAALLARFEGTPPLVRPDPAAECTRGEVSVASEVLTSPTPKAGEHADLEAVFAFTCRQPGRLGALEVGFFEAFPRLRRIDASWALPQGQGQRRLTRGTKLLKLSR